MKPITLSDGSIPAPSTTSTFYENPNDFVAALKSAVDKRLHIKSHDEGDTIGFKIFDGRFTNYAHLTVKRARTWYNYELRNILFIWDDRTWDLKSKIEAYFRVQQNPAYAMSLPIRSNYPSWEFVVHGLGEGGNHWMDGWHGGRIEHPQSRPLIMPEEMAAAYEEHQVDESLVKRWNEMKCLPPDEPLPPLEGEGCEIDIRNDYLKRELRPHAEGAMKRLGLSDPAEIEVIP